MLGAFLDLGRGMLRWRTSLALALQDISLRYRRSMFGPFWISASLVTTVLALAFLFGEILGQEYNAFAAYIGAGFLVWTFILTTTTDAANSMMEHSSYLQNVPMPLSVIAGRVMLRNAIILAHNAVAVAAVLTFLGVTYTPTLLLAIPGFLCLIAVGYFLALILGPISARFRDVPQIIASIMQILFFVTPIIWMREQVPNRPLLADANPLYHLIEIVRAPVLGRMPTELNWTVALASLGVLVLLAIFSIAVSRKRVALWV